MQKQRGYRAIRALRSGLLGVALLGACALSATEGVSDMAVQLFGKEAAGKRVTTGAVFIDGLYIKGPYSVTREGNVILINGQVASRFKVASAMDGVKATAAEAAKGDPAMEGGQVSDEAGATIGSDPEPTLENTSRGASAGSSAKKPSALEAKLAKQYPNGMGLEAKLAAQKKAKELKEASAKSGFNTSASPSTDPMALFEEADYTYTPPSKPEPKAVPYVRPAAKTSFSDKVAANKAREAELAEKAAAAEKTRAEAEEEEISTENFDNLSESEIADLTKRVSDRRALLEKRLEADYLILLSSTASAAKTEKKDVMYKFVSSLEKACSAATADTLIKQWGKTLPRAYLQRIYDNRESNIPEMKALVLRAARELKAAKERSNRRL